MSALCRAGRASSRRYRKDGGVFCGGKPWGIGVTLIKSNGDDRLSARRASQPAFTARPAVEDAVRPFLYFTSELVRAGVAYRVPIETFIFLTKPNPEIGRRIRTVYIYRLKEIKRTVYCIISAEHQSQAAGAW